jgi:hypothetical protein
MNFPMTSRSSCKFIHGIDPHWGITHTVLNARKFVHKSLGNQPTYVVE